MMKSLLLLILTLIAGCRVSSDDFKVKGCSNGWVDFNLRYPDTSQSYRATELIFENKHVRAVADKWATKGIFSLYHNTTSKDFRVIITQIGDKFGEYTCTFFPKRPADDDDLKKEREVELENAPPSLCQSELNQTVYRTETTNITCKYPEPESSLSKFLCKEKTEEKGRVICEDILSTESPSWTNGAYTLIETEDGFKVSIRDVSSEHQGVYWCGVKDEVKHYRAGVKKIQLKVKAPVGVSGFPRILPLVICVVLLVLLLVLVLVYKGFKRLKNTTQSEQLEVNEHAHEQAYEEIQERPQQPDSGTALKSIYATANLPTMTSDPPYYFIISPTNGAAQVNVDTNQSPAYSTVNHPHRSPDDPFYSTLSCPQQQ